MPDLDRGTVYTARLERELLVTSHHLAACVSLLDTVDACEDVPDEVTATVSAVQTMLSDRLGMLSPLVEEI